jgi:SnoaL-like domain
MARRPLPPVAVVVSFIDCVNKGDLAGLSALMSDDHQLVVLDEAPLVGRAANSNAWEGYFRSFPRYVIYPRYLTARDAEVAVVGTTTGSHLGLPDHEEMNLSVLWLAAARDGVLTDWQIAVDTSSQRAAFGIPQDV